MAPRHRVAFVNRGVQLGYVSRSLVQSLPVKSLASRVTAALDASEALIAKGEASWGTAVRLRG